MSYKKKSESLDLKYSNKDNWDDENTWDNTSFYISNFWYLILLIFIFTISLVYFLYNILNPFTNINQKQQSELLYMKNSDDNIDVYYVENKQQYKKESYDIINQNLNSKDKCYFQINNNSPVIILNDGMLYKKSNITYRCNGNNIIAMYNGKQIGSLKPYYLTW